MSRVCHFSINRIALPIISNYNRTPVTDTGFELPKTENRFWQRHRFWNLKLREFVCDIWYLKRVLVGLPNDYVGRPETAQLKAGNPNHSAKIAHL